MRRPTCASSLEEVGGTLGRAATRERKTTVMKRRRGQGLQRKRMETVELQMMKVLGALRSQQEKI